MKICSIPYCLKFSRVKIFCTFKTCSKQLLWIKFCGLASVGTGHELAREMFCSSTLRTGPGGMISGHGQVKVKIDYSALTIRNVRFMRNTTYLALK